MTAAVRPSSRPFGFDITVEFDMRMKIVMGLFDLDPAGQVIALGSAQPIDLGQDRASGSAKKRMNTDSFFVPNWPSPTCLPVAKSSRVTFLSDQ